ncbi:MAG: hypothetical protein ACFFAU_21120 [Candidatus Hodarchaeota archaeon]
MNQTKTIEERLAKIEKDQDNLIQRQYEVMEYLNDALMSIKWFQKHVRDTLFSEPLPEDSEEKYDVDLSLDEIQDTIDLIDELMNDDPFTSEEEKEE